MILAIEMGCTTTHAYQVYMLASYVLYIHLDDFCVDKTDGLHKDDADCRFYYNCGHGQTYRYQCPAGTLFSPSLRICDWERNVDCDEKPKPRLAGKRRA